MVLNAKERTMSTEGKRPDQLEAMVMARLKKHPACSAVTGVVVTAEGDEGDWSVKVTVRDGERTPSDCERDKIAISLDLRKQFHHDADA
jgi:hypothetical protein